MTTAMSEFCLTSYDYLTYNIKCANPPPPQQSLNNFSIAQKFKSKVSIEIQGALLTCEPLGEKITSSLHRSQRLHERFLWRPLQKATASQNAES